MKTTYSIITICFNAKANLEKTILSVINQTYNNYEYIIIDGNSKDGTKDVINRYKKHTSIAISEPDKGIYDAMNKGINLATGKWIIFMNAGDTFINNRVLSDAIPYLDCHSDILYGSTLMSTIYGKYIQKPQPVEFIKKQMIFCHQSCFIKTEYHKKRIFDISYKSSGDYNFFYNAFMTDHCIFKEIPIPISEFDAIYGISSIKFLQPKKEDLRIRGLDKNLYAICKMYIKVFNSYIRHKLISWLPDPISSYIKKQKIKKLNKGQEYA